MNQTKFGHGIAIYSRSPSNVVFECGNPLEALAIFVKDMLLVCFYAPPGIHLRDYLYHLSNALTLSKSCKTLVVKKSLYWAISIALQTIIIANSTHLCKRTDSMKLLNVKLTQQVAFWIYLQIQQKYTFLQNMCILLIIF